MLFRKKPKRPLQEAIAMVDAAVEIAYGYLRDYNRKPTDEELALMQRFGETLLASTYTLQYIHRECAQREIRLSRRRPQQET